MGIYCVHQYGDVWRGVCVVGSNHRFADFGRSFSSSAIRKMRGISFFPQIAGSYRRSCFSLLAALVCCCRLVSQLVSSSAMLDPCWGYAELCWDHVGSCSVKIGARLAHLGAMLGLCWLIWALCWGQARLS